MAASPAAGWCCRSMPGSAPPVDIVPVESALAARGTLGALSPQRRGGLADRPARLRQIDAGARAGAAAVHARRLADPARRRHACAPGSTAISASRRRTAPRTSAASPKSRTHLARNGHIAIVAAVSPSADDRAAARRIADAPVPRGLCRDPGRGLRKPRPQGSLRQGARRRAEAFTGTGNDYQPPAQAELTLDTSTQPVADSTDEIERLLQKTGVLFDESSIWRRISRPFGALLIDPALGLKGRPTPPFLARFCCFSF